MKRADFDPDRFVQILNEFSEARDAFHRSTGSAVLMAGEKRPDTIARFITMLNNYSMQLMAMLPLMNDAQSQALTELISNMHSVRMQQKGIGG